MSEGMMFCKRASSFSTCSAISTVLVPDCFMMLMPTAGSPFSRVKIRCSSCKSLTCARSFRYTTPLSVALTTIASMNLTVGYLPIVRTMYSLFPAVTRPPGSSRFSRFKMLITWSKVNPKATSLCGSRWT